MELILSHKEAYYVAEAVIERLDFLLELEGSLLSQEFFLFALVDQLFVNFLFGLFSFLEGGWIFLFYLIFESFEMEVVDESSVDILIFGAFFVKVILFVIVEKVDVHT
jgi:hypothetical protein